MRLLLALLLAVPCLPAELSESDLANLFGEANTLFRQGNESFLSDPASANDFYHRAALRYERIVREGGVHNGKLFYNIGNAYFRSDDIGRAILNYRRAQLLLPGDANIRQNLDYARSRRQDTFEEKQETRVLKTLLFFHYDLAPNLRAILLAILSGIFWTAAAVRLFRSEWIPKWALVLTGALAGLFLGSLLVDATIGAQNEPGVVLGQQVIARKGDGNSYEPSFKDPLHAGTEFTLMESRPDWLQIQLPDGRQCWIPAKSAGLVSEI